MPALYNEIDPFAADWLERLEAAGHIAPGRVDRRSVRDLLAADVAGHGQRHFFAGIGAWSHALRLAGWPDDLDVWTGSCPCQPLSTAGRRRGFLDDRHLWPAWYRLIRECRPAVVLGEQVASKDALPWLDLVRADLEGAGYAFGAADLCAAGVGAPHIRQRLYFVAVADGERLEGVRVHLRERRSRQAVPEVGRGGEAGGMADNARYGWQERRNPRGGYGAGSFDDGAPRLVADTAGGGFDDRHVGDAKRSAGTEEQPSGVRLLGDAGLEGGRRDAGSIPRAEGESARGRGGTRDLAHEPVDAGATRGFWCPADWLPCRDGKLRPVEPGTFPLAHRAPSRVGRLRAYGNAIVSEVATTFIEAIADYLIGDMT